jgi:acyl transferase domain-containing protein
MDMHSDNTAATAGGSSRFTDVAIIGMAGRFPGAASVAELWQRLCAGTECITHEMQPERGDIISGNSNYPVHAHAAVDGIELFDAEFFGYSSREADLIDPQQRVFLECAWEAMEDAGQAVGRPNGRAAVFAGSGVNTYGVQVAANSRDRSGVDGLQLTIGNDKDYLASRISYKLNFTGPSVTVQTACSTSLVAVHLACQSLIDLECDIALAGGVSIRCPTPRTYPYTPGGIYSPDGHCRPFDAAAAGTVPASGAGVVVLKRLADAIRDGNRIYAVIRGSAINNDGYDKAGFTAPSLTGQVTVIRAALDAAQVPPPSIDFVETHGTATPLGDAVEIAALKEALAGPRHAACALGAIKSNLGHLDTAAGVAGLIKAALCLNHECRPATLHHEKDNPVLGLAEFPFQVDRELTQWPRGSVPRRAGVSSFGIGGTNAHVILEEAPALPQAAADCADEVHVLTLSARTPTALAMAASRLATHLTAHPEASLRDVCFTLQVGRASLKHRRAFACNDVAEAIEALDSLTTPAAPAEGAPPPVIFMFSGQVAARAEAWAPLYRNVAQFRRAFDECARCILELCGEDITRRMAGGSACSAGRDLPGSQRDSLFLFGVEYATAQMLRGLGVEPAAAIGHALGRVAAGCVCGLFGLEDAVRVLLGRHPSTLQDPAIALMSGDGTWVTGATSCAADYSARNVPEPAGFEQGICGIAREYPGAVYLDIGPRQTLAALARSTLRAADPSAAVFPLQVAPEGAQSEQRTLGQTLGELWMRGLDLDWSLWHDGRARRVSLPAYPFERSRHWALAEGLQASATAAVSMEATAFTAASRLPLSRWISLPVWMEAPTSHLQPPPALEAGGCYVVLGRSPLARALRKRLRALGATVIQLTPGARYRRRGEHTYSVDCRRAEDFSRLLRELRPRHVPHTLIQVLAEAPDEAAWTLMQIARSATNAGLPTFELVVCGRELAAIAPHEQVNPFGAMVTGVLQ